MSLLFRFDNQFLPAFSKHWGWFLFFGVVLLILGLVAISAATFTTMVSIVLLGVIILISGFIMAFNSFSFWWGKGGGFILHFLFALLYLAVGFMLIKHPIQSSISLTLLLGIFYLILGIFRLAAAPAVHAPRWGWEWFNGIITLLIGIMIMTSWPLSGMFIIGLFVGIDLVFAGWTYIMLSIAAKNYFPSK